MSVVYLRGLNVGPLKATEMLGTDKRVYRETGMVGRTGRRAEEIMRDWTLPGQTIIQEECG